MTTPAALKKMRQDAGYPSARAAALAMGARVSTYIQHENGKRAFSIASAERYSIFFHGSKIISRFIRAKQVIPGRHELAGLIYDSINMARIWTDAPPDTVEAYKSGVEAVFRAHAITPPATGPEGPTAAS